MYKNRLVILIAVVLSVVITTLFLANEYRYMYNDPYAYFNEDAIYYQSNPRIEVTNHIGYIDSILSKSSKKDLTNGIFVNGSFSSSQAPVSSSETGSNSSIIYSPFGHISSRSNPKRDLVSYLFSSVGKKRVNDNRNIGDIFSSNNMAYQTRRASSMNSVVIGGNSLLIDAGILIRSSNGDTNVDPGIWTILGGSGGNGNVGPGSLTILGGGNGNVDPGIGIILGGNVNVDPGSGNIDIGSGGNIDPGTGTDLELITPLGNELWILLLLALGYGLLRKQQLKNQLTED